MAPPGWEELRADEGVQFEPVTPPEPDPPPQWLEELLEALAAFFGPVGRWLVENWVWLRWALLALGIVLLSILIWQLLAPLLGRKQKRDRFVETDDWVPPSAEATALLEEADRLAAAGNYDGATHLLLKRSVRQIADHRPGLVEPSSTARELAANRLLPENARGAFAVIAERVERSLFALRRLAVEDWQAAREAYARFAQVPLR